MLCEPELSSGTRIGMESGGMHIDLYAYIVFAGCVIGLGASIGAFAISMSRRDGPPTA